MEDQFNSTILLLGKETPSEHSPEKEIGKLMPEEMRWLLGSAPSTFGLSPFGARKGRRRWSVLGQAPREAGKATVPGSTEF